ncbi:hypothetical protein ABIB25_004392 [Nakamurella sp. UYEF19]|uniref:DinB family protein n=1 Tax=Nakamurella sp. UYEF19 TaxID=1756392 RepID=UPI003397C699
MDDNFAKAYLKDDLQWVRQSLISTLDGLSEYDVRRTLTGTGTNLLGLVKHLTLSESVYLGDVFGRPFPEPHPRFDEPGFRNRDWMWAREHETRAEIIGAYQRVWLHSDATIQALPIDAGARVPWWPQPDVTLFNVMIHVLTETNRHAGHADILREQLIDAAGTASANDGNWREHRARVEQAAVRASR